MPLQIRQYQQFSRTIPHHNTLPVLLKPYKIAYFTGCFSSILMSKKQPKTRPATAGTAAVKEAPVQTQPKVAAPMQLNFGVLSVILVAVSFILYFNTLHNGFVLDDVIMVKENTIVAKGFKGIMELLSTPHMRGYLIIPNDTYRPLSLVMFAAEYQFFGLNPGGYHFMNILVFAGCVVLLFSFLRHFLGEDKLLAAFTGAFIFAIHPIHTEVVANIKSRDELLCFLFAFMSLNLFMRYMKENKPLLLIAGIFTMYLSFISKENVITFLGVVPALFFLYKRADNKRAIFITAGTIVSALAFMLVRNAVLKAYDANATSAIEFIDNALTKAPSAAARLATATAISGKYLWLLFIPYPLICNYSYNSIPFSSFADINVLVSLAAYGGMIWYAITRIIKDRKDPFAFAIIFFLCTIALFNNMFILIGAEMGERFLFMPSAAIAIAVAAAADKWLIKDKPLTIDALKTPQLLAVLLPLLLVFGGMTIARNADWQDNVNLYKTDLVKSPNDARLNYYTGTALAETQYAEETDAAKRKEIDKEALGYLRVALGIYPDFTEANAEIGRIFDRNQMYDSAEVYDKKALQLNPNHPIAANNLGSVYMATGKYRLAIETFKKALAVNPNFNLAYFNMARTYTQLKVYDSAIYNYRKMLELQPNYPDALQEMGMAFFTTEKYDSAAVCFKKILALNPNESNALNNLGAIYLNTKNYAEAIIYFNKSIAVNPNYLNAYSNLGRAYYFNKQYQQAIETFVKEVNLDNKRVMNIPYIALSYKALGNMAEAHKYEAIAKQYYSDFKL